MTILENGEFGKTEMLYVMEAEEGAIIKGTEYKKGDTLLVPAYIGSVDLIGNAIILRTFV